MLEDVLLEESVVNSGGKFISQISVLSDHQPRWAGLADIIGLW